MFVRVRNESDRPVELRGQVLRSLTSLNKEISWQYIGRVDL